MGFLNRIVQAATGGASPRRQGVISLGSGSSFDEVEVVGESNYRGNLEAVMGSKSGVPKSRTVTAELYPEPKNRFDPLAVAVWVEGRQVGYLSKHDAWRYQPRLLRVIGNAGGASCVAYIGGSTDARIGFGVTLMLPEPDDIG